MTSTCQCQWCNGNIEFDAAEFEESGRGISLIFGQKTACPHCGKETILCLPIPVQQEEKKTGLRMTNCSDCGAPVSRNAAFCPNCGKCHIWTLAAIVCGVCFAMWVFGLLGWGIFKLVELIYGAM